MLMGRTMLEQEFYEAFREQGMGEFMADEMAKDWAVDAGEYDKPDAWDSDKH